MAEISAELRNRVNVRLLGRRRQIADRHVLDHPATQRAHLGHLKLLPERGLLNTPSSQAGGHSLHPAGHPLASASAAIAASFNPVYEFATWRARASSTAA